MGFECSLQGSFALSFPASLAASDAGSDSSGFGLSDGYAMEQALACVL